MSTANHQKLVSNLSVGRVYRRDMLSHFSNAVDRDLAALVEEGILKKVAPGLYHKPSHSRFGALPPKDEELVRSFLREDFFLLLSWNQYNTLGLGLTQLYNHLVVYNRKRHGMFKLDGRQFDFRRSTKGFPTTLTKEFLLVDLVNNLSELAEDVEHVKKQIKQHLHHFNRTKINQYTKLYGKVATRKFFEGLHH